MLTIGRFASVDFFDSNSYANDPRADFMNWSIVVAGTYDFAADAGVIRRRYRRIEPGPWTVRAGVFDVSTIPNTTPVDLQFEQFQTVGELERRYSTLDQPGKLRSPDSSRRAHRQFRRCHPARRSDRGLDDHRRSRISGRKGIIRTPSSSIAKDIGLFARASWNDGRNEILSFTDIDRSVSGGASISGK